MDKVLEGWMGKRSGDYIDKTQSIDSFHQPKLKQYISEKRGVNVRRIYILYHSIEKYRIATSSLLWPPFQSNN